MDRWYVLEKKVRGPFELRELLKRIEPSTQVCPAGEGEFKPAGRFPQLREALENSEKFLRDSAREENEGQPEIEPTLERLKEIVQHATNKQLQREYDRFRKQYDAPELKIIEKEMRRRELLSDEEST